MATSPPLNDPPPYASSPSPTLQAQMTSNHNVACGAWLNALQASQQTASSACDALASLATHSCSADAQVCAFPGTGVFPAEWCTLFSEQHAHLCK